MKLDSISVVLVFVRGRLRALAQNNSLNAAGVFPAVGLTQVFRGRPVRCLLARSTRSPTFEELVQHVPRRALQCNNGACIESIVSNSEALFNLPMKPSTPCDVTFAHFFFSCCGVFYGLLILTHFFLVISFLVSLIFQMNRSRNQLMSPSRVSLRPKPMGKSR